MTNKEKQKEFLVTLRAIISNSSFNGSFEQLLETSKQIVNAAEEFYPNEEGEDNINNKSDILDIDIKELFHTEFSNEEKYTTTAIMQQLKLSQHIGTTKAYAIIKEAEANGIIVKKHGKFVLV